MANRIVIYHDNCLDGSAAAWCFVKKFGEGVTLVKGHYGQHPPDVTDADVYLVDFSYKRAVVASMIEVARSVTLLDHHDTALRDLEGLPGLIWESDIGRSGCTLAWDFLFPGECRPPVLDCIEDRDLWRFRLPHTRPVVAYVQAGDIDPLSLDFTTAMTAGWPSFFRMAEAGGLLLKKHDKDVSTAVEQFTRWMEIDGLSVPAVNCMPWMASDVAGWWAKSVPFAAAYWDGARHRYFSLRSSSDPAHVGFSRNVGEIAASFGGGGHVNAAGFKVPRDHPLATA